MIIDSNAALEPMAVNLELERFRHHLNLKQLKKASDRVAAITQLRNPLFPVTGDFAFHHCAKTHLQNPALFEAFSPRLIGAKRKVTAHFKANLDDDKKGNSYGIKSIKGDGRKKVYPRLSAKNN